MNNYILGDFNLHISITADQDTQVIEDTLEAIDLVQHVGFSTHHCSNILHLVITEVGSKVNIITCNLGPFISDHKAVIVKSGLQKEQLEVSELHKRTIAKVTPDELNENFCMDNVNNVYKQFISELQNVLDIVTPEKKVNLLKRRTQWYDSHLKEQWKIVRNCEKCWMNMGTILIGRPIKVKGTSTIAF